MAFSDPDSDRVVDADEIILSTTGAIDDLSIVSSEFATFMTYRPNGRVMNASVNGSAGAFTVCDRRGAGRARVMLVDLSGRPRQSKKLSDGSSPSCP
jgi:hypothetical protein